MIIEKISRSGIVLDHYQFEGPMVRLGRAYDNDLILHDPYVEDHHVSLTYDIDVDGFYFEDLNTVNGTQVTRDKSNMQSHLADNYLASGDSICVGKTLLRIRSRIHEVPPAIPISIWDKSLSIIGSIWVVIFACVLLIVLQTLSQYFLDPRFDKLNGKIFDSANNLFIVGLYAAFWAMVARVQRQESRLLVHASLIAWFLVINKLQEFLMPVLVFNFNLYEIRQLLDTTLTSVFIFAMVFASLYLASELNLVKRIVVACLVPVGMLLSLVVGFFQRPDFYPYPDYDHVVVSPVWQWGSSRDANQFIDQSAKLYESANQALSDVDASDDEEPMSKIDEIDDSDDQLEGSEGGEDIDTPDGSESTEPD